MRTALTAGIWAVSVVCVLVGGMIAFAFVTMATSMDPSDLLTEGPQTWIEAGEACLAAFALLVVAALALRLWHSARFQGAALLLLAVEVAAVVAACLHVYAEYF